MEQYQPQSCRLQLKSQYLNPFDFKDIKVDMIVISPSGKNIVQPGFFDGDKDGILFWGIRFTPCEIGDYSYRFKIQSRQDTIFTKTFLVKVVPGGRNGFLRLNPVSNYTLKFDSGRLFRGFGENVCWTDDYEYYFKKLHDIGCNFVRIWMCPWNLYLEWTEPGLGRYHLGNAARLDSVLSLAEKYDIYIMLCFDYHGVVQKQQGYFKEKKWDENPYNQKNGGPCKTEADFFRNPIAKKYYKNRLNYIVARYAYSPHILAWEFWNEVDLTAGTPEDVVAWHREMATYLRQIDPYDHLITTSFSYRQLPAVWQLDNIDITQSHLYNKPNFAELIPETIERQQAKYGKPHIIGEFGSDYRGAEKTRENDPENVAIHNALWAGLFSPTPISPLTWWWDELVEADNLYFHFQAITNFAGQIAVSTRPIEKLTLEDIRLGDQSSPDKDRYAIYPSKSWGKNTVAVFRIQPDGQVENKDQIPSYLYGKAKSDMKQPPTFKIKYRSTGRFSVHVDEVSDFGLLRIYLDGKPALEKTLPLGDGKGEWQESVWKKEYNLYQGVYNKSYGIDVPAGRHTIRVENNGRDWIKITRYQFENAGIGTGTRIKVMGVRQSPNIFLWFRHEKFQWQLLKSGQIVTLPEINSTLTIPGLTLGRYQIEWWDTCRGKVIRREVVSVTQNNEIKLKIPALTRDLGCKIIREVSR